MLTHFGHVRFFVTPWTIAHQAPLSMRFSRQEHCRGLPCPPPGDLPDAGIKPASPVAPALQVDSLPLSHRVNSRRILQVGIIPSVLQMRKPRFREVHGQGCAAIQGWSRLENRSFCLLNLGWLIRLQRWPRAQRTWWFGISGHRSEEGSLILPLMGLSRDPVSFLPDSEGVFQGRGVLERTMPWRLRGRLDSVWVHGLCSFSGGGRSCGHWPESPSGVASEEGLALEMPAGAVGWWALPPCHSSPRRSSAP